MAREGQQNTEPLFELVYEGPGDDAPRTLQLIKGVFVADLNFPIPEVQRILEHAPTTIASGSSESSLKEQFSKLKSAGARVLIVKRGAEGSDDDEGDLLKRLLSEAEHDVSDNEEEVEESPPAEEADISFEFDLDTESHPNTELHAASRPKNPLGGKVYALDLDASEIPDDLMATLSGGSDPVLDLTGGAAESALPSAPEAAPSGAPPPQAAPPGTGISSNFTLLGENELREFHKARGGALEESPQAPTSFEEENPFENLEDSLKQSLDSEANQIEEAAERISSDAATAVEVALVLSEVSLDLAAEAAESATSGTSSPISKQDASKASAAPSKGALLPPSSMGLSLDLAEEDASLPPPPPPKSSPQSPPSSASAQKAPTLPASAEAPSPLSFETTKSAPTLASHAVSASPPSAVAASRAQPSAQPASATAPQHAPPAAMSAAPSASDAAPVAARSTVTQPARKPKALRRSALEFALPILVGSSILAAANWAYFGGAPAPAPGGGLLVKASDIVQESAASSKSVASKPIRKWLATETYPDRRIEARIQEVLEKKVLGQLSITSPPQRARTNEEIAQNTKLPPWLKRFEAANLVFKPNEDNAKLFSLEGPAFFYVEYDGKSQRYVGRISASATQSADTQAFTFTYQAQLGVFNQSAESTHAVVRSEDGSFAAFVSGDLELR